MDIGAYELTAIVVFKSLWWIIPCIVTLTVGIISEHVDIL
jgi:hypothetical protein